MDSRAVVVLAWARQVGEADHHIQEVEEAEEHRNQEAGPPLVVEGAAFQEDRNQVAAGAEAVTCWLVTASHA